MTRRGRMLKVGAGVVVGTGLVVVGAYLGIDGTSESPVSAVGNEVVWSDGRVRVEVLNAGGVSGMGREATLRLRRAGFDVVELGNVVPFDSDRRSEVVDRVGRTDIAQAVANALGIDNVQGDPDPNLYVDVSVLLGSEWTAPDTGAQTAEVTGAGRWWDPRGWFGR